ncbi:MAG: thioredoxin family protein [Proteobacteria bacterium]|nr:thioredoxin family protein [Pseudomonadota bacterium]
MKVEMFYTPGCSACTEAREQLRLSAEALVEDLEWRELNVLENLDHAVELGVLTLPAIVIDGELVFTSMPTVPQLHEALKQRQTGTG